MNILLLTLLFSTAVLFAQSSTGEITGQVTDETGAAVPNARVLVQSAATGETHEFQTDADGGYLVTQLFPGAYLLTVEKAGFRRFVRSGVVLQVGQRARIDARMSVGAVSESVEVTAAPPLLDTEDASLGQVIENRKILELPLNGRNIVSLAALATGVVPGTSFGIGVPDGRAALLQAAAANLSVNGGMSAHNDVLVDGTPLSLCCQNQIAFVPSIDATEEFRVRTNLYDAQYGRTSGGVITYASRSGSNELHGSVFEFLRNRVLDANNFFNNRNGIPKGHFIYNQFGGRAGGRVIRDKAFFFVNYEGVRNRRGSFLSGIVPTADEQGGVFPVGVYDPLTVTQAGGVFTRTQFPGNRIPASRMDPVAVNVGKLWPAPNTAGATNFLSNASALDIEDQINLRFDYHVSQKHRLFLRDSYNRNNGDLPDWFGNIASSNVFSQQIRNHNAVIDDTLVVSPTFILNFRYGFTRQSNIRQPRSEGTDLTQFGWPASFSAARQDTSLTKIALTGYLSLSSNALFRRIAEAHSWAAGFTQIRARHTLRYGLDYRVYRANWVSNGDAAGTFTFNNAFTRGPNAQTGGGGSPMASFLLGYPASGGITILEPISSPQPYIALYFQDDFRVNNRLTLNLGMRWEVDASRTEWHNRLSYFDPNAASPVAAQTGIPGLRGGLRFLGADGNPSNQQNTDWNNIGPRFGFAWKAFSKMVFRGGYGITFLPTSSRYVNNSNQGFAATTNFFSSVDGITPVGQLRNPFPTGIAPPPGKTNGLLTSYGESFGTLLRDSPVGYSQQWSFDVQYELAPNTLLDAAYTGSKGTALPQSLALNALPSSLLSQGNALLTQVANPLRPYVNAGALSATNTTRRQLQLPFPQFLGITDNAADIGSSIYHSFQMKINKRFSQGFSILGSYTAGKLITDAVPSLVSFLDAAPGFQDVYNRRADRAIATQDIAQRLAISYVWEAPVGRGKRFLSNAPPVVDAVLGGWQVNGITVFQGGQPLVIGNSVATTSGANRPNNNGQSARKSGKVDQRLNEYFTRAVFSAPGPFEFGSTPRTLPDARSDGTRNFDISIFKNFAITEKSQLQFRAELFNAFNTPRFDAPNGVFGNAAFGVISAQDNQPRDIQLALRFSF